MDDVTSALAVMEPEDMAGTAQARSGLYGFLASVYQHEVTAETLARMREPEFRAALEAAGASIADEALGRNQDELLEELAVEYTRLFIGPGRHVSPHASVHLGGDGGSLLGESTAAVKRFIESSGFEFRPRYRGPPDHIGVEPELMERLARAEARAWREGDGEAVARCLEVQQTFLEQHVLTWLPGFCEKVAAAASLAFYREMAELTVAFVGSEREEAGRRLAVTASRERPSGQGQSDSRLSGIARGRDCGPPALRRARAGADLQVRCREQTRPRAGPINWDLL